MSRLLHYEFLLHFNYYIMNRFYYILLHCERVGTHNVIKVYNVIMAHSLWQKLLVSWLVSWSVSWSVSCQYHVGVMVSIIVSIIVSIMSVSWSVSLWLVSWSLSLSISWSVSCQYYVNFMVCIMVRWAMHYLLVHSIRYSVTHVPWSVSRRYPGRYHDSIMFSIMVSSILFIVMTVSWSVVFYLFIYGSIVAVS